MKRIEVVTLSFFAFLLWKFIFMAAPNVRMLLFDGNPECVHLSGYAGGMHYREWLLYFCGELSFLWG